MRSTRAFFRTGFLLLGLWLVGSAAMAAPVSGTVLKAGGNEPLFKAEVQLLRPGTEEIQYRVLTDARGRFAVPRVAPGYYEVRVKFGRRVLMQLTEGDPVRYSRLRVGREAIRLPALRVR